MSKKKDKISTDGSGGLSANPFDSIDSAKLQSAPKVEQPKVVDEVKPLVKKKNLGRVDIRREKAGRGGKEVTVVEGLKGDKKLWLKKLQKQCGVGGALKEGKVEIQGDKRDTIKIILEREGYRVVYTGG